ncbi:hypothetical protein AJ78_05981 [Emergomyces pasteurianus Ep9510]|uniref:Uncharacterized protein n=1 Tax=Emergomyces pasteurianus Ep9510 TaxID=1447872 RepID=A0A1J9QEF8_9EURO|nr:hypothetical protein AJ78_05981 [Emergomyces pasteurianus Ep9510]
MSAFHEADSYRLFNNESNYAEDVFSDHSDNNIKGIKKINSENSENSDNSNDSDEEILENDKLSSSEHYETEKIIFNVKQLQQRHLKKIMINNMNRVIELIIDKKKLSHEKRLKKLILDVLNELNQQKLLL